WTERWSWRIALRQRERRCRRSDHCRACIQLTRSNQIATVATRCLWQMVTKQGCHVVVAATRRLTAHYNGYDAAPVIFHRCDKVEARSADIAGFDAVDALNPSEHPVVGVDALLAIIERTRGEVAVVAREMLPQSHAQDRHVTRRCVLLRIWKPV